MVGNLQFLLQINIQNSCLKNTKLTQLKTTQKAKNWCNWQETSNFSYSNKRFKFQFLFLKKLKKPKIGAIGKKTTNHQTDPTNYGFLETTKLTQPKPLKKTKNMAKWASNLQIELQRDNQNSNFLVLLKATTELVNRTTEKFNKIKKW